MVRVDSRTTSSSSSFDTSTKVSLSSWYPLTMSSLATSSPVSASTLAYLMRWPVLRLIWLKETFSVSDVAGYRATGQVTSERRKKPFQLARGAIGILRKRNRRPVKIPPRNPDSSEREGILSTALTVVAGLLRHGPEFQGQARGAGGLPGRCRRRATSWG